MSATRTGGRTVRPRVASGASWRSLRIAVMVLAVGCGALVGVASSSVADADGPRTWYVAPWGDDTATGTVDSPLTTVGWAIRRAGDGDAVVLRGGVYREQLLVEDKRVHIAAHGAEHVVLDGSVPVDEWRRSGGDWVHDDWTKQFHREPSGGTVRRTDIVAGYPDQVFLDGRPLRQVLSRDDVVPGTFWHETDADRIWIGDDPAGHRVDVSKLDWAVYLDGAHGSSLRGITVRRYATEARYMAAVRAYADDLVLDDVLIEHNSRIGVSAIGSDIVVRDSRIVDNGHIGVHAHRVDTLVVEDSIVVGNNKAGFDDFHSAAGIKVTSSRGVTVRGSDVSRNDGPGIWTDLDTTWVTLSRNLVEGNGRAGIEIELSRHVNVLDNVVLNNAEAGVWVLESQDVQVLHNASIDNQNAVEVEEGPRREVRRVAVHNNLLGRVKGGSVALLDVNDWTGERSADQMDVSIEANAYWLPPESGSPHLTRWGRAGATPTYASDLQALIAVTGEGHGSVLSTSRHNPFARSPETLDFRPTAAVTIGVGVHGGAARELGVPDGTRLRIGPVTSLRRP